MSSSLLRVLKYKNFNSSIQASSFVSFKRYSHFFLNFEKKSKNISDALSIYVNNGKIIRNNPSPEFFKIQNLIKFYDESDLIMQRKNYDYPFLTKFGEQVIKTNSFFIALTAPSMTGKTQLVFSLDSKFPLYFAFSDLQPIYENFTEISEELLKQSLNDYKSALAILKQNKIILKDSIIERSSIRTHLSDLKFRSLGLLLALVEDAEENFEKSNQDWMHFYADRYSIEGPRRTLKYSAISVNDFKNHPKYEYLIQKYFVFLDEFSVLPQLVLVRNLCIYLSLTCVVSSTNSKVANLMGLTPRSGSGTPPPSIWSVVVPKLPPITLQIASQISPNVIDRFQKLFHLAYKVSKAEGARMESFVRYLINDQLKHSRPGVARFVIESMDKIVTAELDSIRVDQLLTSIVEDMVMKILNRKDAAFNSTQGIVSNVKLLLGNVFDQKYSPDIYPSNEYHLIDSHFYYLKNPHNQLGEPFVLYFAQMLPYPVVYLSKEEKKAGFRDQTFHIQCFFDKKEELLLLACLMAYIRSSITNAFSDSLGKQTLGEVENPSAIESSGLLSENIATAALIDSSHFCDAKIEGTFEGIKGGDFLNNLLSNLNPLMKKNRLTRQILPLVFTDPRIESYLNSSLKVPFLMPAGMTVPPILKELFGDHSGSLHFGEFFRTPDQDQIDARFDLLKDSHISTAVVECKNWAKKIPASEYSEIIKKAFKYGQQIDDPISLHLTFCKSMADFGSSLTATLKCFNDGDQVNFLKIDPLQSGRFGFAVNPIGSWHENPSMIAMIIEMDVVVSVFNRFPQYSV